jgi:hypothetical protein
VVEHIGSASTLSGSSAAAAVTIDTTHHSPFANLQDFCGMKILCHAHRKRNNMKTKRQQSQPQKKESKNAFKEENGFVIMWSADLNSSFPLIAAIRCPQITVDAVQFGSGLIVRFRIANPAFSTGRQACHPSKPSASPTPKRACKKSSWSACAQCL